VDLIYDFTALQLIIEGSHCHLALLEERVEYLKQ
jgi:hypothetical protein